MGQLHKSGSETFVVGDEATGSDILELEGTIGRPVFVSEAEEFKIGTALLGHAFVAGIERGNTFLQANLLIPLYDRLHGMALYDYMETLLRVGTPVLEEHCGGPTDGSIFARYDGIGSFKTLLCSMKGVLNEMAAWNSYSLLPGSEGHWKKSTVSRSTVK